MLALLLLTALQLPGQPGPRVLHVGPGEEFPLAAEALAAAHAGDTIRFLPGVHRGALRVESPVVLVGDSGAVVDGEGRGTVLTVNADSVQIHGLEIRGAGRSLDHDDAAVKLVRCTGCRVIGTRIREPLHGIYLLESHDVELRENDIVGNAGLPEARRGNGIHLFHSSGVEIAHNRVRGTRDGIYFSFSSGNRIRENDISLVRYGLHYMYSDDNRFERNRFRRNAAGAAIMFSSRILFRENTFAEHVGYRAYGILLQTAYEVSAEGNRIEGNLIGVFLDMSENNTFRHNVIAGNGIGVDMIASAEGNTFVGNVLAGNRTAVRKPYGQALNTWAVDGRGNYWGDRSVYDLDGDGVGDRPHAAGDPFAGLAATRPVLEVFAGTPAALALSWAERAFPMFDLPRVVDPAPLVSPPAEAPRVAREKSWGGSGRKGAGVLLALPLLAVGVGGARRVVHGRSR